MATIRKRKSSWQAIVRRKGYPPLSKSFTYKSDATEWARSIEREIDRGELGVSKKRLSEITVGELLKRYEQEVTPRKKGAEQERYRLRTYYKHAISKLSLEHLTPHEVAKYRDDRLKLVQSGSVRRELAILQHCIEVARIEWGLPMLTNPVALVKSPPASKPRDRRLRAGEYEKLLKGCELMQSPYLRPAIILAVETGMRRGELLALTWQDIDFKHKTARIRDAKNGYPRTVPLSDVAVSVLQALPKQEERRVLDVSANALRLSWERLKRKIGVLDLRFHDLRHEAVSRLFDQGLPMHQVAYISGHRDPRMLMRYAHWSFTR